VRARSILRLLAIVGVALCRNKLALRSPRICKGSPNILALTVSELSASTRTD